MIKLNSRSILLSVKIYHFGSKFKQRNKLNIQMKTFKFTQNASVILISNCERLLFIAKLLAQQHKTGRRPACHAPAWALGPTADGWAAEPAQRRYPPGLLSAHFSGWLLTAVDLKIDGAPSSRQFRCGIKMQPAPGNPR
jgi:hypothetical protein